MATINDFMKFTKQALEDFGEYVSQNSRKRFLRKYKNQKYPSAKGKLYNAIDYELEIDRSDIRIKFPFMRDIDYAKYVDKGVRGKTSSYGVSKNSPFRFGSGTGKKGGLRKGIFKWIKAKRFQFRDEEGKFLSYKSMTFLISRKIYNKGIPAKKFFTRSFDEGYKNLPDEIVEAFALDVKKRFKEFTIK